MYRSKRRVPPESSHRSETPLGIAGDDRKLIDPSGMKV